MTTDLKNVSDAELEEELERRKAENKGPPKPLEKPDFTNLINCVVSSVERAVKEQRSDEDIDHYICEEAMEAIYGKDIWSWWNNQAWNR